MKSSLCKYRQFNSDYKKNSNGQCVVKIKWTYKKTIQQEHSNFSPEWHSGRAVWAPPMHASMDMRTHQWHTCRVQGWCTFADKWHKHAGTDQQTTMKAAPKHWGEAHSNNDGQRANLLLRCCTAGQFIKFGPVRKTCMTPKYAFLRMYSPIRNIVRLSAMDFIHSIIGLQIFHIVYCVSRIRLNQISLCCHVEQSQPLQSITVTLVVSANPYMRWSHSLTL